MNGIKTTINKGYIGLEQVLKRTKGRQGKELLDKVERFLCKFSLYSFPLRKTKIGRELRGLWVEKVTFMLTSADYL